jgi:hypothetical protein
MPIAIAMASASGLKKGCDAMRLGDGRKSVTAASAVGCALCENGSGTRT